MDRRKFIKTSMCLGCGAAIIPSAHTSLISEYLARFSKEKFVYKRKEDMPKRIRLEACSLCQLNCEKCWIRRSEIDIKKSEGFGYLKFKDFKNLVDDNPQIKTIELSSNGEMFLNPELDKIIKYAYKKNVELTAYNGVNLNTLSEEMAETLVKYQYKNIVVSIDGATPDTYKIYRKGGDLNRVFANIERINYYKVKYNSKYPELTYKFIVFGHNEHEIELAKQKAKELDMTIKFSPNDAIGYSPIINQKFVSEHTGLSCYSIDSHKEDFKKKKKDSPQGPYVCTLIMNEPTINWNGNLMGCCALYDKNFGVNVFKEGLFNALNHKNFIEAKHLLTDLSYRTTAKIPCTDCPFYKFMQDIQTPISAS